MVSTAHAEKRDNLAGAHEFLRGLRLEFDRVRDADYSNGAVPTTDSQKLDLIWQLLTGNGDIETGLVYQVLVLRHWKEGIDDFTKSLRVPVALLIGGSGFAFLWALWTHTLSIHVGP